MVETKCSTCWIILNCLVTAYGQERNMPRGPWQLGFKVVSGKWESSETGSASFWDLFTSTNTYMPADSVQNQRDFTTTSDHMKSSLVEDWARKLISVQAVKLSFFKNNREQAYIVFDGTDKTKSTWFKCDNILYSSYTDLGADNSLGQQCPGNSPSSGFPLTIMKDSYWHTSCSLTTAWTVVVDVNQGFSVCPVYAPADGSIPKPYFKYSKLTSVAHDLTTNLEQADSIGIFFQVWDMVFKGIEAIKPSNTSLVGLTDLYRSDSTENDNSDTSVRNLQHDQSSITFKSGAINAWEDFYIDTVKFSMLKSSEEKAYVVFDGINANQTSWFSKDNILYSSYGNDLDDANLAICSIEGDLNRNWQIQSVAISDSCSAGDQQGWMLVKEPRNNGSCDWDTSRKKPYFLYNTGTEAASPGTFSYADVMAVFVHGWRIVFKVSAGGSVAPATSLYTLWSDIGILNENNEAAVSLVAGSVSYKSSIVDQWDSLYIHAVKIAVYKDGLEVFYAVFDATGSSSTDWLDCDRLLYTSVPGLDRDTASASDYTCSFNDDEVFSLFIGKESNCSTMTATGVLAVVDTDSTCSQITDLPQILYSNTITDTLTDATPAQLADTVAVFVDMDNCFAGLCENGATCQDTGGNFRCFCTGDYYGQTCANLDGLLSDWSVWSACSVTCGDGLSVRTKTCVGAEGDGVCEGVAYEEQSCSLDPCPVDGGFTSWSEWTVCSKYCETGDQSRSRTCTNPVPAFDGADCVGVDSETQQCNTQPCPVNGGHTEWTLWNACTVTCGTGNQSRSRTCTQPVPAHGGQDCEGEPVDYQDCNTDPCPIDGGFTDWTEWSKCTQTCGTGSQSRSRDCTNPAPQYGGADCLEHSTDVQSCNANPCPIDGGYTDWTVWSDCIQTCGIESQVRSRTCTNPTPQYGGANCIGDSTDTQECNLDPCPINGGFTEWSDWSVCTKSCGTGSQSRSRDCTNPTPQYGGTECTGITTQIQNCNDHVCPVDGGFTDWTEWSECTQTCGTGSQSRSRDCTNPAPQYGGVDCIGLAEDSKACNTNPCPVNGGYTDWTAWGDCTVTCETGTRSRSRDCTDPAPQYGGEDCAGTSLESQSCNQGPCPIHGGFSPWTEWDDCSQSCGTGNQSRSRSCTAPVPQYGGADCLDDSVITQSCNTNPCPVDGGFTDWSDWTGCSRSCGSGDQTRTRSCMNPVPQYGGSDCIGIVTESQLCNRDPCPVDGGFTEWSDWSACTQSCGTGSQTKTRACTSPAPQYGGNDCVGQATDTQSCNTDPCLINGGFSEWSEWDTCTKTCGTGNQDRSRDCTNPAPQYGGIDCTGQRSETQDCNTEPCPINGAYTEWTTWTDCTHTCGTGIQSRSRDCTNPVPQHGGSDCLGESMETQPCNTDSCPVDGGLSVWSEWGLCTKTCGTGTQTRSRDCTNPTPQYGGADCDGHTGELQDCNTDMCPIHGGFTVWTQWGGCTQTCGTGSQSRSRDCTNPVPQYGGSDCVGENVESLTCNTDPCPVDGGLSIWSEWGLCTKTCGSGTQTRSRDCTNPTPQYGGADCDGHTGELQDCNTDMCPIHGGFTDWTEWEGCTQTCGTGVQTRSRDCTSPAPQYGGSDCSGERLDTRSCNSSPCPIHGGFSEWSEWNTCTKTCGTGSHDRSRDCTNPTPQYGGIDCTGERSETEDCNTESCPIDGGFTEWSEWTACSLTCGGGSETRSRDCLNPAPQHGGRDCVGDSTEQNFCNTHPCPIHGGLSVWSEWDPCTKTCGTGSQDRSRDCTNPAPQYGGIDCTGERSETQDCNTEPCPIDGGFTVWSEWTACSLTCEGGSETRSRDCLNPAPQHGGSDCVGDSTEQNFCNTHPCPINGGFSDWSQWDTCTKTCGTGSHDRSRDCTNPAPQYGGIDCIGERSETQDCNTDHCPVDGGFTEWSEWTACSLTCGGGSETRSRDCSNPAPQHGGRDCVGDSSEQNFCNTHPCPIDGGFSVWTAWGECTQLCGWGIQIRSRGCTKPAPQYGGTECDGDYVQAQNCNLGPCAIDGAWTVWTQWSQCSLTCGSGIQTRSRQCVNPVPQFGGKACEGNDSDVQTCSTHSCPVDGIWSDWTAWEQCTVTCGGGTHTRGRSCTEPEYGGNPCDGQQNETETCGMDDCPPEDGVWLEWSEWAVCSKSCGDGVQIRARSCTQPQYGGKPCDGHVLETVECNLGECPVNGSWSVWTKWSGCTESCGRGIRGRTRTCTRPQYGGVTCIGHPSEISACNTQDCPSVDGGWTEWTDWSPCTKTCGTGDQSRSRSCSNPEPDWGGNPCDGNHGELQYCNDFKCPIDGGWSEWSAWSLCLNMTNTKCTTDCDCGHGNKTRIRLCDSPAPRYNGTDCEGTTIQLKICNNPCADFQCSPENPEYCLVGKKKSTGKKLSSGTIFLFTMVTISQILI